MNPDVKDLWVNALESGEYEQGRAALCQVNPRTGKKTWCCLGVLCDLAAKAGIGVTVAPTPESRFITYDGDPVLLPPAVREWAGLRDSNPKIGGGIATAMNDYLMNSFTEIAAKIREHL